ncbi:hypothetical protein TNCV_1945461, partial [Trichonephila clavipes]
YLHTKTPVVASMTVKQPLPHATVLVTPTRAECRSYISDVKLLILHCYYLYRKISGDSLDDEFWPSSITGCVAL